MGRLFNFLVCVAATFYIAVIYKSNAFIYLGFIEIALVVLLLAYNLLVLFKIRISLEAPLSMTERGKKVPVKIKIQNYSIFPTGKISIKLVETHNLFRKKRKTVFYAAAEGRKINEECSTTVISAEWHSNYSGKAVIRLVKARSFDLLGLLTLPIPKKMYQGKEEVVVLPSIYEVPIEISNKSNFVVEEQERFLLGRSAMDETVADQFQIREYQPGDKIRSIHWKLTAKADELMVRDYIPVISCPVLLFINVPEEKAENKKSLLQKRDKFFTVLLSVSKSMAQQQCVHYVIWYDKNEEDVLRFRVEKEEDIYRLLMKIDGIGQYPKDYFIEEAYYQRYREGVLADKLVLDWGLHLVCNDENEISYDTDNLEKSLSMQEIFL